MSIDFAGDDSAGEELYGELLQWIAGLDIGNTLSLSTAIERRTPWGALSPNLRREIDDFAESLLGGDDVE